METPNTQPTTTETPAAAVEPRKLETEVCSRCGGSGHHSYCQRYGTTCFKCHGAGKVYTKRGRAAALYLDAIRSVPAKTLRVGDVIRAGSITADGTPFGKFTKILSIEPGEQHGASLVDGEMVPYVRAGLTIETGVVTMIATDPESMIRKGQTAEEKAETFRRALDYQDTLTKAGTPRKRAGK
jgi:hypothetical protein